MKKLLVLACILLTSCTQDNGISTEQTIANAPAPKVGVFTLYGLEVDIHQFVEEGRPAIINFWAASCAFCRMELPWFQQLHMQYPNMDIVGVNMQEPTSLVTEYWQAGGYTFPTLLDPNNVLRKRFRVSIQPTTLFIDISGRVAHRKDGPLTKNELNSFVKLINTELYIESKSGKSTSDNSNANIQLSTVQTSPVPALLANWYDDEVVHNIDLDSIMSGGPTKDGIPSIDSPIFQTSLQADLWLNNSDLGILVSIEDDTRFYPNRILNWHEIVNDTVGGKNIFVTYCPLCATAVVYLQETGAGESTFGVSGLLRQSNLLMYDRATESLWNQITGEAIVGPLTGQNLEYVPSDVIEYSKAKNTYKNLKVLHSDTGFGRDYDRDPYEGYDESDQMLFPTDGMERVGDLHPKTLVHGIAIDGIAKAYTKDAIERIGTINDEVNGVNISITFDSATGILKVLNTDTNEGIVPLPAYWFAWLGQYPETDIYE